MAHLFTHNYFELMSFETEFFLTKVKNKTETMLNAQLSKQVIVTFLEGNLSVCLLLAWFVYKFITWTLEEYRYDR